MAEFSGQDEAIALSLARGETTAQTARAAGCSVRTVQRRKDDSEFMQYVRRLRGEMVSRTTGMLASAGAEAVLTLRHLLTAESDSTRLGAAKAILELGAKIRNETELEERIAELEQKANDKSTRPPPRKD